MDDIIDVLQAVYQGLNKLQVAGIDNAALLGSCGEGLRQAIRTMQVKMDAEKAEPGAEENKNG